MIVGAAMLLGWSVWGVYGIPTPRLESLANYPNPFDSRLTATSIVYSLPTDAAVTVRLYDLLGRPVREWNFHAGENGARNGENRLSWDGTDESGAKVSAGGYVCQVLVEQESGLIQGIRKIAVIH